MSNWIQRRREREREMADWIQHIEILEFEIEALEKKLKCMKRVLGMEKNSNERSKVKKQERQIKVATSEKQKILELYRSGSTNCFLRAYHVHDPGFVIFWTQINVAGEECQIYEVIGDSSSSGGSNTSKVADEKVMVGFKEKVETLMGKLWDIGEGGPLEIISIVGAVGSGKTTLARAVYDDPCTSYIFEIRAWVNVSQEYDKTMKRELLIRILRLVSPNKNGDYEKSSEYKLGEEMLKCLKGKKYLIVMDDIWGIEAWNDIQRSLPKECNGSKVLFTSRGRVEPSSINCDPHCLAPLPESYSWKLLEKKVFRKKCCPPMLVGIDEFITEKFGPRIPIVLKAFCLAFGNKTSDAMVKVWERFPLMIAKKLDGDSSSSGGSNTSKVADEKVVGGFKEEVETLMGKLHDSNASKVADEKVVVGFKEEVETLMGKLHDSGEGGQLEIISIVGAAGCGKTTLAREVYDHPWTSHTFEIRAWVNIFQDYNKTMKRNLLIRILELISPNKNGDYEESSEDKLGEEMLKCLKGKKYLIVMDDLWDIEAWNDIQRSLPKECNGSKVLFTSRVRVEPNGIYYVPHFLAPLPKSCSWELLQKKVFRKKSCPPELVVIGEHIAEKCDGLPLAIVAIAGILAMEDKTLYVWEEVSKRLSSIIAKNQDDCMEILELSYNHLPLHLKACFVYIGGFPEDSEILVRELIWLWIAEGFIQQNEGDKSLEDVAKDYLRCLIDRSLVTVARKRSFGGIKACRIHDLLRELCLKKAEEDNFLLQIYGHDTFSPFAAIKHRRLFIGSQFFHEFSLMPCTRNLRSFLCLSSQNSTHLSFETNLSFFVENFELLRVLCFISAECRGKIGRGHLVHLRYLALQLPNDTSDIVWPFSCLFNLETVNLRARFWKTILLPRDIFKMIKLRHLYAKRGVFKYHFSCLYPDIAAGIGFDRWSKLESLQTLHSICPCEECRNFLARTPNLRKLGFCGDLISSDLVLMLPDLEFLKCLKTLSFNHQYFAPTDTTTLLPVLKFPPTITQLTLENTCLRWEELSILQTLPSLEILKLSTWACRGQIWNTVELEVGFSQLKYLRLQDLDIEEWNASEDQFPRLEVLVIKHCTYLEWIPIDFANLNELREIEVRRSRRSVEKSAKEIQKERRNTRGDDDCINLWATSNTF